MFTKPALITFFLCAAAQAQVAAPIPSPARKSLLEQSFGKPAWIRTGVAAGWNFVNNRPHEWGRTTEGFGKRYASSFGGHLVKGTVQYGVGSLRDEDLTYYRSDQTGFGRRIRHAVASVVVARHSETGRPMMALSRISGTFTGAFVSRLWHPERLQTASSGFATAGVSFGVDAASKIFREFWRRRQRPAAPAEDQ